MEMGVMEVEAGLLDKAGPSDQKLATKTEAKEDSKEYCKLKSPTDDIYSEAVFPRPPPMEVNPTKPTRSRKGALLTLCIVLGVVCLAELVMIFILLGKSTPTAVCPEPGRQVDSYQPERIIVRSPCFQYTRTLTTKSPNSHRCPESWVFFENSCFYLSTERRNWDGGRTFCQNQSGDLAVVSSGNIQDFLKKEAKVLYWIGLRYDTTWKWVNGGSYSGFTSGTRHSCGYLQKTSIASAGCTSEAQFICQKQAS